MYKNNLLLFSIFLFILLLNNSNCSLSSVWGDSNDVIKLTNYNFHSKTKQFDILLVMFYVKWCSHCRRLHPEYEQAGSVLAQNFDSPIYIAKFDCTDDKEAQCAKRYNIDGYPTLRIYRYGHFKGEELNYRNRTKDEIIKTMKAFKQNRREHHSDHTNEINDEILKGTANIQQMWPFMAFFIILCRFI